MALGGVNQSMSTIGNRTAFARENNVSRATDQMRILKGWKFGILNGELVMYNPNMVKPVLDDSEIKKEL